MHTNLIIVEGLPGSGKSTTAAMIAEELQKKGKHALCFDEGEEHPADYKDYGFPDFETEREKILEKWQDFVRSYDRDAVYVFNCVFLQNPMCETMMRFDMGYEQSRAYIAEIAEMIKPLDPVIVYIDRPDIRSTVDGVIQERGNDWLNAVIGYHTEQGYGKRCGLSDYDGYLECLAERRRRELDILRSLDISCFTVSEDLDSAEFKELYISAGWNCPPDEQIKAAIQGSTKSYIVRHRGKAAAMINWLGDFGMHWFMKDFIVRSEYQGQMIGTLLCRYSENFIRSTMNEYQKVCIDLRSFRGKEGFYQSLGYNIMSEETGAGMEKMLEK